MNKIILSGYLAKDPEGYGTKSGKTYVRTSIAVNRKTKNAEGKYDADFFNLVAWEKTGDFLKNYFGKGSKVLIEGRLQNSNYEKDGVKHYNVDVIVETVEFADSKRKTESRADGDMKGSPVDDDDVPF